MQLADEQVGQRHEVHDARLADGGRQRLRELPVQPDRIANEGRKIPALGEALAGDHVVDADHGPLDVGNIAAEQVGRLDDLREALGQRRVERDLADVVKQPTDKGVGGSQLW
jgi:hypothetical protein